jgi:hypothetical protein
LERHAPFAAAFLSLAGLKFDLTELARAAVRAGIALDPNLTIRRLRAASGTDPVFLAGRERAIEAMRMAGVPEG